MMDRGTVRNIWIIIPLSSFISYLFIFLCLSLTLTLSYLVYFPVFYRGRENKEKMKKQVEEASKIEVKEKIWEIKNI